MHADPASSTCVRGHADDRCLAVDVPRVSKPAPTQNETLQVFERSAPAMFAAGVFACAAALNKIVLVCVQFVAMIPPT